MAAGQRLMWFICLPLAMVLLFYNFRSYTSMVANGKSHSGAATPGQRQFLVRQNAALRAMRRLRASKPLDQSDANGATATASKLAGGDADDEAAAAEDATEAVEVGDKEAEEAEPEADDGKEEAAVQEAAEPADDQEAAPVETSAAAKGEGAADGGDGGDGDGEHGLGAVSSVVSDGLSFVASSAIGTANAAAATVASIGDTLRNAAGNTACKPQAPNW